MVKTFTCWALLLLASWPATASSEPIKLKLAFSASDRTSVYRAVFKPFVDAVNDEAKGLFEIESYPGGALGKSRTEQAQMVRDGVADIAFILPGATPEQFPDNPIVEFPGLYANLRESNLVFTRLVAAGALRGYEDFVALGAFVIDPDSLHTRMPVASLSDFKNLRISVSTAIAAATAEKLGMRPALMTPNLVAEAISKGQVDGAMIQPGLMFEFGIARVVTNHYLLRMGATPFALVMNRQKFESLPAPAKAILNKYSGEALVNRDLEFYEPENIKQLELLKADPKRKVIVPSPADLDVAQAAFKSVIADWTSKSPRNRELLTVAEGEIAKLRAVH